MTTPQQDMCVLKPIVFTDAMLASSSVLEVAPAAYAGATVYASGVTVSVAGAAGLITVYKSLQAGNVGHAPASSPTWWSVLCSLYQAYSTVATYAVDDRVQDNAAHKVYQSVVGSNTNNPLTDTTKWSEVGATNAFAAFDDEIGTLTSGASPLIHTLRPGSTAGLILMDIVGVACSVVMRDTPGGTVVANRTINLDASMVEDIYDWFFAEPEYLTSVVLTDLPSQWTDCELTVTITTTSGMASVGVLKPSSVIDIGKTRLGARVGIISRNKLNENEYGNLQVVRVPNSKKASLMVTTEASRFNLIYRTLKKLDGILCCYVVTSTTGYEESAVYGLFSDFYMAIDQRKKHLCALELKGSI
jgi:hypothetical protein